MLYLCLSCCQICCAHHVYLLGMNDYPPKPGWWFEGDPQAIVDSLLRSMQRADSNRIKLDLRVRSDETLQKLRQILVPAEFISSHELAYTSRIFNCYSDEYPFYFTRLWIANNRESLAKVLGKLRPLQVIHDIIFM